MQGSAEEIPYGHHLVVHPGRGCNGQPSIALHKTTGFEFAEWHGAEGFILNARLLHRLLATVGMPGTVHQVLNALITLQDKKQPTYVFASQRDVIKEFNLANGHVAEAMTFFQDLLWIRGADKARPRRTRPADPPASYQLTLMDGPRTGRCLAPARPEAPSVPEEVRVSASAEALTCRLNGARSTMERVRIALEALGGNATPTEVQKLLTACGQKEVSRETVRSALARIRKADAAM